MIRRVIISFLVLFTFFEASATHLLGGIMTYRYVGRTGPNQSKAVYVITIKVYRDCLNGQADFDNPLHLGVYDQNENRFADLTLDLTQKTDVKPPNGGVNCNFSANVCIQEAIY